MNSPPIIKGLLFDFDGTLARTMEDLLAAWQYAFRQYGVEIQKEDYFPLEGMKTIEIARTIAEKYQLPIPNHQEIVNLKDKHYEQHHSFSFYPGVVELIERLCRQEMVMGIVTASSRQKIESTVPASFLQKFKVVISQESSGRGKPFPDPYLAGLRELNLTSDECLVVENAPLGVASAKKAGLYCIAITSTLDPEQLREADEIIAHCKDIIKSTKWSASFPHD